MDLKKQQKDIIFKKLRDESNIPNELREKFEKQISDMDGDELSAFLKSMQEIKKDDDLQAKIAQLQKDEKESHNNLLEMANKFSRKITEHIAKKQEAVDKSKIDTILNKIKSL